MSKAYTWMKALLGVGQPVNRKARRRRAAARMSMLELLEARTLLSATTELVSKSTAGVIGYGDSPSMSADGRYVAFQSSSNNLVPDDTNSTAFADIFVRDRETNTTTRVNVSTSGVEANAGSNGASLSANGRYVVFQSGASNLVEGDTNKSGDIFVHDQQTGETTLVSKSTAGVLGNSGSGWASISADGRFVAFSSNASNLVDGDTNGVSDIFVHDRQTGETTRVSVDSLGTQSDGISYHTSISADGRFVAFTSEAKNLIPGDPGGREVYVHDRVTGQTTRVSVDDLGEALGSSQTPSISADGSRIAFQSNLGIVVHDRQTGHTTAASVSTAGTPGNATSDAPAISANGRYVMFGSSATNLVPGDTNLEWDVFVHDLETGETRRVSVSSTGEQGNDYSFAPGGISGDGRFVAFYSHATNLVPGGSAGIQVFVRDQGPPPAPEIAVSGNGQNILDGDLTPSGTDFTDFGAALQGAATITRTFRVDNTGDLPLSISTLTLPAGFTLSEGLASVIAPGAFDEFTVSLLTGTAGTYSGQIVLTNNDANENPFNFQITGTISLPPGTTELISVSSAETQGDNDSLSPAISADGRYVAFQSRATNVVDGDTNARSDIFVRDRETGKTTRVSLSTAGLQSNGVNLNASISGDGRYVAFQSDASNLVAGDTNASKDIFVHDRQTGVTTRVSVDSNGVQGNSNSLFPSISADGRYVAFFSNASNLVAGDVGLLDDIFVHDRQTGQTVRVSVSSGGVEGNGQTIIAPPSISANGQYVAFASLASNLVADDTNGVADIFVHSMLTGQTTRVSVNTGGTQANLASSNPVLSGDGRFVAFQSEASNLVAGDANGVSDIFVHDRQTGQTVRIGPAGGEPESNGASFNPGFSANGRYVAFNSNASNLVDNDTNLLTDTFVFDRQTQQITRINRNNNGEQAGGSSTGTPSLTADGRYVAYESAASNLVANDINAKKDIFVHGPALPEVKVSGNGENIFDGDTTPSTTDHTSFGSTAQGAAALTRTFRVENVGGALLTTSNLTLPTGYTVIEGLSAAIAPGAFDEFTVALSTANAGTFAGQISFLSNDADESPFNFQITGTIEGPEIQVRGNGYNISDGDLSPSTTDHTSFGSTTQGSAPLTRTFTVRNVGTTTLTLSSLTLPAGFTLDPGNGLVASLAAGAEDTFTVILPTANAGIYSGEIKIVSNDANENPFNFKITGTVEGPEIQVRGNGYNIADGDLSPSITDHTSFGSTTQGSAPLTRTFTVRNVGTTTLTLGTLTLPTGFTLDPGNGLVASLAAGAEDTFTVILPTVNAGTYAGEIKIVSNDGNENPFNFKITGTVQGPEIQVRGNGLNIGDGDTSPSLTDHTDFGSATLGAAVLSRTFTVRNLGTTTLTLSTVTLPAGFTIDPLNGLVSSLAAGEEDTFTVLLSTGTAGTFAGDIVITNNDANESPFNFRITGLITPV